MKILLKNGSIIDGTGKESYKADLLIEGGCIAAIGAVDARLADRVIDVQGKCVAPGFITSPMTDVLPDAQKEALLTKIPAGKLGEGADIAAAVAYLASDEAAYVTGQTLHVNGGMAMV